MSERAPRLRRAPHPGRGPRPGRRGLRHRTSGRTSCRRRGMSCCARVAGCDGVLTLLTDRVDDELLDAAGPGLQGRQQLRRRLRQRRCRGLCRGAASRSATRRASLTETTADLAWALMMAAARRRARRRPLRPRRPLADVGPDAADGLGRLRRHARCRRTGTDRPGGRTAGVRLRDDGALQLAQPRPAGRVETELGATYVGRPELLERSDYRVAACLAGRRTRAD